MLGFGAPMTAPPPITAADATASIVKILFFLIIVTSFKLDFLYQAIGTWIFACSNDNKASRMKRIWSSLNGPNQYALTTSFSKLAEKIILVNTVKQPCSLPAIKAFVLHGLRHTDCVHYYGCPPQITSCPHESKIALDQSHPVT
jgi:hypothetical protein